ncbi:MAG: hypothetical protein JSU74_04520 [Candidatus Zixiibacteriota bacterium]|nr:MAG: hypothetical protein JSU74_04520 [candidate division Zixibacteria bacterium]
MMDNERIKLRILIPLTIAVVVLIGTFITGAFHLMHHSLEDEIDRYLTSARKVMKSRHHADVESLSKVIEDLTSDPRLQQTFAKDQRAGTRAILEPVFHELARNHNVTHLSLYYAGGKNFLSLQLPRILSDTLSSTTLAKARETGRLFFGMELSRSGAFCLRVAAPWYIGNSLTGFIELGKEFTGITREIPRALGIDLVTYIDKKYILRDDWEKTYSSRDTSATWDTFPDCVIIDNSFEGLPPIDGGSHPVEAGNHTVAGLKLKSNDASYCVAHIPLVDVQNRVVGHLAIYYDATRPIERTENVLIFLGTICLAIGLALFISFYLMLDSLERELLDSREKLVLENNRRLEVEQKHARELAVHVLDLELARTKATSMPPPTGRTEASAENRKRR